MKCILTGTDGFVGKNLLPQLVDRGYDVDKAGTTVIDVDKPRDKREVNNALVPFEMGSLIQINNVSGSPVIGFDSANSRVFFHSQRKDATYA